MRPTLTTSLMTLPTKDSHDHRDMQLPKVREQRGQRGRRGRGPTAYEAICLTSGMSSASTGIICSVRSVCALHTTHCRPNVTFRIGLSGNNLWKQSKANLLSHQIGWDLTPCVGHAQSRECPGGSEMIQPDGKKELP